jgi:hypothetical protein
MTRPEYIGIDPDVDKSGVAVWDGWQLTTVTTMRFFELISFLEVHQTHAWAANHKCIVYVEAGWLNTISNFHHIVGAHIRENIAKKVGENHCIGKLLAEYCKEQRITCHLVKPTQKKWDAETFKKITGFDKRTNSEMRDAARLVFGR